MASTTYGNRRKALRAACGLVAGVLLPTGSVFAVPDNSYRLVFADEFNGTSVDTSKWAVASPSWTMPNSLSTASASQVSEGNGVLTLNAVRTGSSSWSSGSVSTYGKYTFAGGYVESRIQLPSTPGSWPAFWGLYNGWPPEADIMEYPLTTGSGGLASNQYNTNFHYTNSSGSAAAGAGPVTTGSSLAGTWHTFGMDWTSGTNVTFYLDGVAKTSFPSSSVAQMANMYMILDYAVGGWPGTPSTGQWAIGASDQTKVDWVRVWQKNSGGDITSNWKTANGGTFSTSANWASGVPKYGNMVAGFGTLSSTTATISMGSWQVFGGMTFNGTTGYTVGSSSNTIQLAGQPLGSTTNGATVQATSGSTVNQNVNAKLELWSDTTFSNNMAGGQTLNLNGRISGGGTLNVNGAGTVVLNAANSYTGGTTVSGGIVRAQNSNAFGPGTVNQATGNRSAGVQLQGDITIPSTVNFITSNDGTGSVPYAIKNVSGNNTLNGTITLTSGGGGSIIQSDSGALTLNGNITIAAGQTSRGVILQGASTAANTINGIISNLSSTSVNSVTKNGAGTWTLSGANTYTGPTSVTGGQLVLTHAGTTAANSTSAISVSSGATLSTRGAINTSGALTSAGTLDLVDNAIANLTAGSLSLNTSTLNLQLGNGTSSDRIAATGAANVTGTVANNNANIVNLSVVPGQSITNGGTYTIITAASGLDVNNFKVGTTPASLGFTNFTLSTPTPSALVVTATGNPTPTVAYFTGAGSIAIGDTANGWGAGATANTSNWSTSADGTNDPQQLPGSITDVIFNAANAPADSSTSTTQLDASYVVKGVTFDVGNAAISSAVLNTSGNVLAIGADGLTLTATSTAVALVNGGGSIQLAASQNWANQSNKSLSVTTGMSAAGGATTLTFNGTGSGGVNLYGVLADGAGKLAVVFDQAGTTTLSASNTYTGGTVINSGTVDVTGRLVGDVAVKNGGTLRLTGNADSVADTGTVDVQTGGTLDVRGAVAGAVKNETLALLTGGGTVTRTNSGNTTLTVGGTGASGVFSGSIQNGSGGVSLVKTGGGTLTLAGSSNYSGGTTLNASGGAILVTNGNALGTGALTIGQGNTNEDGTLQIAGNITLGGVPTINLSSRDTSDTDGSAQIENVSGNNTVTANLNINNTGGTAANIQSDSGTLTLTGRLSSTGLSTPRGFDFFGDGDGVVSGMIANGTTQTTFVQKDDDGAWTLSNSNTYTGGTTVNGGTLNVTGSNTWGSGALTVNDGTVYVTANNTFTGGTTITGTSTVSGGGTATGGRVVMTAPSALGVSGSGITLSGNGTLEVDTDGGDAAYNLHVGTTNTVNLVSGVKTGSLGINHTFSTLAIGNSDVVNVTAAANITGGSPAFTINTVNLSSGFGAGSTTFNPTTASLTLGSVSTTTSGAKTLVLDGTSTDNLVSGVITNGTSTVSLTKSNTSVWTVAGANTYTGATAVVAGTLNVTGSINAANTAAVGEILVGNTAGSAGTLNFSGVTINANSIATNNTSLRVGDVSGSTGTLTMTGGTLNIAGEARISPANGSHGTFNLNGGTVNAGSGVAIGRNGADGNFNQSGGFLNVNAGNAVIGTFADGGGQATVTGGTLTTTNALYVGEGGTGTLNVSGAGSVVVNGSAGLRVASNAGSVGTVNLGNGAAGGTITTTVIASSGSATFNFNGGTLKPATNSATFFSGLAAANVRNGGATIDTNNFNVTIAQMLRHSTIAGDAAVDGGLFKTGLGTLILTGTNTYTGPTTVAAGTVRATSPAYATLFSSAGGVALGTSDGTLILDYTSTASPAANIQSLLAAGAPSGFTAGQIRATDALPGNEAIGYLDNTVSTVTLRVTLAGDADLDKGVSINDFNALSANFGQTGKMWVQGDFDYDGGISINDFNLLAANFGKTFGSSSDGPNYAAVALWDFAVAHNDEAAFIAATGVPEPTALAAVAVAGVISGRRRRRA